MPATGLPWYGRTTARPSSPARASTATGATRTPTRSNPPTPRTSRRTDDEGHVDAACDPRGRGGVPRGRRDAAERRLAEHGRVAGLSAARLGTAVREAKWLPGSPEIRQHVGRDGDA